MRAGGTPILSAEPLVGLKHPLSEPTHPIGNTFSRTPRGFEAPIRLGLDGAAVSLSAEPLVGLKRRQAEVLGVGFRSFSRTPRGFEARAVREERRTDRPFSRTPRGFEAEARRSYDPEPFFQPNPSWV